MERDGMMCESQSELEAHWPQSGTSLMRKSISMGPYLQVL